MRHSRRDFIKTATAVAASLAVPGIAASAAVPHKKRHIVTLSFDDGFKKSFLRTAEIYEKHKLSAIDSVDVLPAGRALDKYVGPA